MKKTIFSMLAILIAISSQAQFYAKAGLGINMAAAKEVVAYKETIAETEIIRGSFGKGISPVLGIGYMINDHIGFELAANYLIGAKYEISETNQNGNSVSNMSAKGINLMPAFVLKGRKDNRKISPYTRIGLAIGLGHKFTESRKSVSGTLTSDVVLKYKAKPSLGFTGALGLRFKINNMIQLWAELNSNSMSATFKSGEITKYDINGKDELASISPDNKTWDYKDKIANNSPTNDDFATTSPLSSFGLAIGVAFTFGK